MRAFVALSALVAAGVAQNAVPVAYGGYPYAYAPATYAAAPVVAPAPAVVPYAPSNQFQAQDEFGNLQYGYSNLNSVKHEVGNTYAGVSGGYSYVDANGQLQRVEYIADGAGFRVADSRLPVFNPEPLVAPTFNPEPLVAPVYTGVAPEAPVDTPEVAEAKAAHLAAVEAAKAEVVERRRRDASPAVLAGASRVVSAPTPLIHNPPVRPVIAAPALGYAGLPYAGLPHAGLPFGYAGVPALAAPVVAAAPAVVA